MLRHPLPGQGEKGDRERGRNEEVGECVGVLWVWMVSCKDWCNYRTEDLHLKKRPAFLFEILHSKGRSSITDDLRTSWEAFVLIDSPVYQKERRN